MHNAIGKIVRNITAKIVRISSVYTQSGDQMGNEGLHLPMVSYCVYGYKKKLRLSINGNIKI